MLKVTANVSGARLNVLPAPSKVGRPKQSAGVQDAKRAAIVAAARTVFAQTGVSDASMRAIAAQAGIAAGTIYRYFANAEQLYGAVLVLSLADLKVAVATPAMQPTPFEEARSRAQGVFTFYSTRPDDAALGLYLHRGLRPSGLGKAEDRALNDQLADALTPLRSALQAAFKLDELDTQRELFIWMAAILGIVIFQHTGRAKSLGVEADSAFAGLMARLTATSS
jgi:AcrR family transcriptional regulator